VWPGTSREARRGRGFGAMSHGRSFYRINGNQKKDRPLKA
jgi:hypothetical protein